MYFFHAVWIFLCLSTNFLFPQETARNDKQTDDRQITSVFFQESPVQEDKYILYPFSSPERYQCIPAGQTSEHTEKFRYIFSGGEAGLGVLARAYYRNDQRIQWSGNETVFGAESVLVPKITLYTPPSRVRLIGEFYLNQPYDKQVYLNNQERRSYAANYDIDPFETSQLYISWQLRDFEFRAGKFETPFGRCLVPMMSNAKADAPFIRTESILWRQTGFLFRWTPSVWELDAAIVNGCAGLDTNSMKAIIGRAGMNFKNFQFGISGLFQDGNGSEETKEYKNHIGLDAVYRFGNWTLSAEGIYDEYGLRRNFNPDDIFWEKSIYYRQIHKADAVPITGFGYYINLNYQPGKFLVNLNYGEFYPEQLHHPDYPQHDIVNRRLLVKAGWNFNRYLQWYGAFIFENNGYVAQDGRTRSGWYFLSGIKFDF
ncbi:MAG: hypothetical protein LBU34_02375 [Planctomycetaceae bacterium]|nr:hypothetical protein [Planctomycetaceae bacterium]